MDPITVVIVDDEEFAILDLREELGAYPAVSIVGTFSNGLEGLQGINQLQPDLVFVDIEMPKLNGFEMLGQLTHQPIVIFCTGYSKYALEGYEYDPADFLLKPLKTSRFQTAMERAFADLAANATTQRLERQKSQHGYIVLDYRDLHGDSRRVFVWPEEILFIQPQENNGNYIEYNLVDGTIHVIKRPLKRALEELAPLGFMQVHKSYVINPRKIVELYRNEWLILNGDGAPRVPVSRGYRKEVKQLIQQAKESQHL